MKKIYVVMLLFVFLLPIVFAGVTNPNPSLLQLMPGESGRFKFQIQALNMDKDIVCSFDLDNENYFDVVFDDGEALIDSGSKSYFYGTITVPEDASYGDYSREFCVSCNSVGESAAVNVNIRTCNLPLNVAIVEQRTQENMYIVPKPAPDSSWLIVLMIGLIIISLAILLYKIIHSLKNKDNINKKRDYKKVKERRQNINRVSKNKIKNRK